MGTLFNKLIYTEIPEGFTRKWIRPLSIIWGLSTAALLYGLIFLFGSMEAFQEFYDYLDTPERQPQLYFLLMVTAAGVGFRAYIAVTSITQHDRRLNNVLEDRYVAFIISSIIMQNIVMLLLYAGIGMVMFLFGYSAFDSFKLKILVDFFQGVTDAVPTLVQLPYWAALLATYLSYSLCAYFAHRMGHESRLLWLLAHRPHHVPTTLCSATTVEADPPFALGLVWKIIAKAFLGSLIAKVFHEGNTFFIELAILHMAWGCAEIFNHSSAHYERIRKNKWLHPIMTVLGTGPYHVLHHSAEPEHAVVNLGSDLFLFWDRVFGTFHQTPEKIPALGLTHQPDIYHNPLNFALAGVLQISYELRHNKDFVTRLKIIFAGIFYVPPVSKSFLKKPLTSSSESAITTPRTATIDNSAILVNKTNTMETLR